MVHEKVVEKLNSLFKEELWGRIEPKDIGISKFKILDDLFNTIVSGNIIEETLQACKNNLEEHPESITSIYLVGLIGYHKDNIEDSTQLRRLLDIFIDSHKWANIELISEKILEYGESSVALRALALSLERLGRNKEAIPILENLLKIDRFDADVAKKLAIAIVDDEPEKSIHYMKLSIEGFIKNEQYDEVTALWNKLVSVSWEDILFFERIERQLVEAKQQDLAASLLKVLLLKYRDEDNPDQSIELLKKILDYKPEDNHARRELVKLYQIKYGNHSQFEQFMKLSKLSNFKIPVKYAIQDFEKNIVFDKGNYAFHISWKLGKIEEIDSEAIVINFPDKPMHNMSIQMALQSLTPVSKDHIWVMEYEDKDIVRSLFEEDFIQFFEVLIKSYGGKIVLADIKRELIPKYVEEKNWSKWWSRARTKIKKDSLYGISEKKKDLIILRDKPVTFADELLDNFTKSDSFSEKLDYAIEFINNIDKNEGSLVASYFINYFTEETKGSSSTRQILSYFILKDMVKFVDAKKIKIDTIQSKVLTFIKESQELPLISMKISSYDYKKGFVNLIQDSREDWPQIFSDLLFETPVRIHKYIINSLIRAHAYNIINTFISRVITGVKQSPEIFIWVARNLYTKTWEYDWLDFSSEELTISFFRLMKEMKKIELEGNRLKNLMVDILFNNESDVLKNISKEFENKFLSKIFDLFRNVSYVEESEIEKFNDIIKENHPDFQSVQSQSEIDDEADIEEKLIVSKEEYDKMKDEFESMVNVEMVRLSKELAKVSDPSGDLRENVEYNALMEKQSILELAILKLDNEIKRATILDAETISVDAVSIGTKVILTEGKTGEKNNYTILGPWDADFEKKILSYRSPIAKSLIGRKKGEEVILGIDEGEKKFTIDSIKKYTN